MSTVGCHRGTQANPARRWALNGIVRPKIWGPVERHLSPDARALSSEGRCKGGSHVQLHVALRCRWPLRSSIKMLGRPAFSKLRGTGELPSLQAMRELAVCRCALKHQIGCTPPDVEDNTQRRLVQVAARNRGFVCHVCFSLLRPGDLGRLESGPVRPVGSTHNLAALENSSWGGRTATRSRQT